MTAPASPPVTSVTANVAALLAFCAAHPTNGVYIYTDSGQAPTGAGVAASTIAAAFLAADKATLHIFTQASHSVVVNRNHAKVRTSTNGLSGSNVAARLDIGTVLYVNAISTSTDTDVWYTILDGTYTGDFINRDDVDLLT